VAVFLACSVICFVILTARRVFIGGELGGPSTSKYVTAGMMSSLWLVYIILSILNVIGSL
jgi:solute carrier family 8 (sodium/calcium exchanger)